MNMKVLDLPRAGVHPFLTAGRRTARRARPVPPVRITNTTNEVWQYKGMPPQNEDNEEILVDQLEVGLICDACPACLVLS